MNLLPLLRLHWQALRFSHGDMSHLEKYCIRENNSQEKNKTLTDYTLQRTKQFAHKGSGVALEEGLQFFLHILSKLVLIRILFQQGNDVFS